VTGVLEYTSLHGEHVALGGKMVPFAGFELPVHYPAGITAEHRAVRERAGLFDVSHMGEFRIHGPEAEALVQYLTVNDVTRLEVGQAQYSAFCREDGGVLDDLLVYRRPHDLFLVVNAANRERDLAWVKEHAVPFQAEVEDVSHQVGLIALQGPLSSSILAPQIEGVDLDALRYYRSAFGRVAGVEAMVSRTGYTGEDGFELYVDARETVPVWQALMESGSPHGLLPAGLGCRDSLRLEMGYALYGNDLDEEHSALESGLGWVVKLDSGDFLGREALGKQKGEGVTRRLVGLRLPERAFPRSGYPVVHAGEEVGSVTSGVLSPSLGIGVAMGYVPSELAKPGTELGVRIRSREVPAQVSRPPFYLEGSLRR